MYFRNNRKIDMGRREHEHEWDEWKRDNKLKKLEDDGRDGSPRNRQK